MSRRRAAFGRSQGLARALALAAALAAQGGMGADAPPSAEADCETVCALPEGESPWWPSRYGAQDQVGTLNEITPEREGG